jgi:hypothetical protein
VWLLCVAAVRGCCAWLLCVAAVRGCCAWLLCVAAVFVALVFDDEMRYLAWRGLMQLDLVVEACSEILWFLRFICKSLMKEIEKEKKRKEKTGRRVGWLVGSGCVSWIDFGMDHIFDSRNH